MSFFGALNLFGMSGTEIYHNFRGGTGDDGRSMYTAAWDVMLLTGRYEQRATSITTLTTTMENAWRGDAAGAAQRGAGPLAVEHGLAQDGMNTAHTTLNDQVMAFNVAKSEVTEVPPEPEKPGVWDNMTTFGGAGRNYENQMTDVSTANDHNVAVMESYEGTTSANATAMPTSYGRITDDYSTVGVEKPPPPPPPGERYVPPPSTTGNSPGRSGTTGNGTTVPTGTTNTGQTRNPPAGTTRNPPGTTTPSNNNNNNRPVPPRTNLPPGRNPGNQQGNPALPGMMPPGFGPTGGDGSGRGGGYGKSGGFGPGGSGSGGPGAGGGSGAGARPGSGFGPGAGGAAAAAEGAAARGAGTGRGMGMGGMGHGGGGRRGQGEDDGEHERPSFLVEPDPHETFGTDEVTAPPVIGG